MRRSLVVAAVAAGLLGVPSIAAAAPGGCGTEGPYEYQAQLMAQIRPAEAAARDALGAQYTMSWLGYQGWAVGLAPGPLNLETARAAIVDRLAAHVSGAQVGVFTDRLHVVAQPYSETELTTTQAQVEAAFTAAGVPAGA